MLNISWPELENDMYSSSFSATSSERIFFKFGLFNKLRERLNPKEDQDKAVDIAVDSLEKILREGWKNLTPKQVMILVEEVLDYILPHINFPGPDFIIRPIVKRTVMNSAEPLVKKLLGTK